MSGLFPDRLTVDDFDPEFVEILRREASGNHPARIGVEFGLRVMALEAEYLAAKPDATDGTRNAFPKIQQAVQRALDARAAGNVDEAMRATTHARGLWEQLRASVRFGKAVEEKRRRTKSRPPRVTPDQIVRAREELGSAVEAAEALKIDPRYARKILRKAKKRPL